MIIIRLWGGVGNQLFQYVYGQYLKYNLGLEVRYDDNAFLSVEKIRKQELNGVDVSIEYDNHLLFSKYRGILNRILLAMFKLVPTNHFCNDLSVPSHFDSNHLYFLQGYWQDPKYYLWLIKNEPKISIKIKEWPEELKETKEKILNAYNSVSLHIRRGDYFTPKYINTYGVCGKDYYQRAIDLIDEMVSPSNFFIFSDDLEWVKENIKLDYRFTLIPNYDVNQFAYIELMSYCKHHIISNSSFSWWGAILNETDDTVVISPKKWTLKNDDTIALEKWIKI